jgi:hypothetical protein
VQTRRLTSHAEIDLSVRAVQRKLAQGDARSGDGRSGVSLYLFSSTCSKSRPSQSSQGGSEDHMTAMPHIALPLLWF